MKKWFLIIATALLCTMQVKADSPLTSTDIYKAYMDVPIVAQAARNKGNLSREMMDYLYNEANPMDVKIALINAVGWNFDGLPSFKNYLDYCKGKMGDKSRYITDIDVCTNASPKQLVVMAYLAAMSNYSDMHVPMLLANLALLNADENSQAFMMPIGLIFCQEAEGDDMCKIMEQCVDMPQNKDVREDAVDEVMDYINFCCESD